MIAGLRKLGLMMSGCYASLSHFRMKFEALRAVGIFFSQRLHESGNDGQNSLQRGQVAVTNSAHYLLTRPNNAQRQKIRTPDLSGSICRGTLHRRSGRDPPLISCGYRSRASGQPWPDRCRHPSTRRLHCLRGAPEAGLTLERLARRFCQNAGSIGPSSLPISFHFQ